MDKDRLLRYLLDKKETISKLKVFPRELDIKLSQNFVHSVIGPRRAGKTYFLYYLILNKLALSEQEFVFIDFDDPELTGAKADLLKRAVDIHEEKYGQAPAYLFFDEIQNLEGWARTIKSLLETKQYYIFISGSSSKLLSKEIATSLRGKSLSWLILPFSFREYLQAKNFSLTDAYSTSQLNRINNFLNNYLTGGGFPNVIIEEELSDKFFQEYVDLVVFRDVVERHGIENIFVIKFLIKELFSSFAKKFSINKTYRSLKSQNIKVSKKTLYEYSSYLEDAFLVFLLKKYSPSLKKSSLSLSKAYINDNGLASSASVDLSKNVGRLIEQIVFLELKRRAASRLNQLYYWESTSFPNEQVDFVVKEKEKVKQLIQVCYKFEQFSTRRREIRSLLKASQDLSCSNLLIITSDQEKEEKAEGKKIKFVPLWKWLLDY